MARPKPGLLTTQRHVITMALAGLVLAVGFVVGLWQPDGATPMGLAIVAGAALPPSLAGAWLMAGAWSRGPKTTAIIGLLVALTLMGVVGGYGGLAVTDQEMQSAVAQFDDPDSVGPNASAPSFIGPAARIEAWSRRSASRGTGLFHAYGAALKAIPAAPLFDQHGLISDPAGGVARADKALAVAATSRAAILKFIDAVPADITASDADPRFKAAAIRRFGLIRAESIQHVNAYFDYDERVLKDIHDMAATLTENRGRWLLIQGMVMILNEPLQKRYDGFIDRLNEVIKSEKLRPRELGRAILPSLQ